MDGMIDIHHHAIPDFYVHEMAKASITKVNGLKFPTWTPKKSLSMMDSLGIEKAILSFSTPGIEIGAGASFLARRCNDYLAAVRDEHPGRFGGFGTLPLADTISAERELIHVLDELQLDGISLLSSVNGAYPDHERYTPLFDRLNEKRSTVFIHPTDSTVKGYDGLVNVFYGWFIETSRAVALMDQAGIFDRFPAITFVLAHGGGALPVINGIVERDEFRNRKIYCDTAKIAEERSLTIASDSFGPVRILFGSDFPWANAKKGKYWIAQIEKYWKDRSEILANITRGNAEVILSATTEEVHR